MNFLVTGAAGFLGSALANRLAHEGHQVRGLDDLSAGDPQRLDADVLFTRGDVTDRPKLWTLLQDVDCIYHLAARVSVPESVLYPREYNAVNVGGTVSIMEAMRDVGVKRVVLISSGAVYGDQGGEPLREDAIPNPLSPYAVSKLAAEYYVRTIGSLWGIETVSLRVFNAYGPGQPIPAAHPPVVPHFLRQAVRGGTIVIHGRGEQTRDFVYLDDVVEAMVAASTVPTINRRVINVGSGVPITIRALAQALEVVGSGAIGSTGNRRTLGRRRCARLDAGLEKLGLRPTSASTKARRRMVARIRAFQSGRPE
jgi:UDP-glucose 4-epimerase